MACLICERSAEYDLVRDGEVEAEVCKKCTEEFLAVDEGNPTCVYCDRPGVYDVRTQGDGGFPGAETTGDTFATPYESVLCEEHFEELGGEKPAGSPEAADEADVEAVEGDEADVEAVEGDEADVEAVEGDEADVEAVEGDETAAETEAEAEPEDGDGAEAEPEGEDDAELDTQSEPEDEDRDEDEAERDAEAELEDQGETVDEDAGASDADGGDENR